MSHSNDDSSSQDPARDNPPGGASCDDPGTGDPPSEDGDGGWWSDPKLQRERLRGQVEVILAALPGAKAWTSGSQDLADLEYLYRDGVILVRDSDLERVHSVLGGDGSAQSRVRQSLINGLTSYATPGDAIQALRTVDQELGVGVATPDHILYVTVPAGCCPATEPLQPLTSTPVPPINPDPACSGRGVVVSVVDTGLAMALVTDPRTPWLAGVTGDPETIDPNLLHHYAGHGTFAAGVVRSMAPEATVRVEGFLPNGGAIFESEIVRQLDDALDLVPDIISLSAGATTRKNLSLLGFEVFWETRLRHYKGTVLVAAAGNDANRGPFWPATFPWSVSVGALDAKGARAPYTNVGSWVDVYARGSNVVNAFPDGRYIYDEPPLKGKQTVFSQGLATWSGTSFATPLVAGLIASRMSRTGESGRVAANALLRLGLANATPGVGPVLEPGMGAI